MSVDFNDYLYDMYEHYFHNESTNRNMMFDFVTNMPITIIKNDYKVFLNDMAFMKAMFDMKDKLYGLKPGHICDKNFKKIIQVIYNDSMKNNMQAYFDKKKRRYQIIDYIDQCIYERKKEALIYINNPFIRFGANKKHGYNHLRWKDFILYNQNMLLKQFFINITSERGDYNETFFLTNGISDQNTKQIYTGLFRKLRPMTEKERVNFLKKNNLNESQQQHILGHIQSETVFKVQQIHGLGYKDKNKTKLKLPIKKIYRYNEQFLNLCGNEQRMISILKTLFDNNFVINKINHRPTVYYIQFDIDKITHINVNSNIYKDNKNNIDTLIGLKDTRDNFLLYMAYIHLYLTERIHIDTDPKRCMYLQYISCLALNRYIKTNKKVKPKKKIKVDNEGNENSYVLMYNYFFNNKNIDIVKAIREEKTLKIIDIKTFMEKTLEGMSQITDDQDPKKKYKRYMINDNNEEYEQLAEMCGNRLVWLNGKTYSSSSKCNDGTWYIYRFKYNPYPVDVDLLNRFSENEHDRKTTTIMLLSQMEDVFAYVCGYDIQKEYHIDTEDEGDEEDDYDEEFGAEFDMSYISE